VPRRCSVCVHPDAPAINQAMINRKAFRAIACQFGVGRMAAVRHHDDHLPEALAKARAAAETAKADDLLLQLKIVKDVALTIMAQAQKAGDGRTALAGVREARSSLELLLELEQRLDRRPTVNVLLAPEWLLVRSTLLDALRDYPEARSAVAASLLALEAPA
jgi:hypothetical protein